jgi:phytoene dehydrogenase-like protein
MARLGLARHGLDWTHAPTVLAHPRPGRAAVRLQRDADLTAKALDDEAAGDGDAWLGLQAQWSRLGEPMLRTLLGPVPPVRAGARLVASARLELLDLARLAILPVRRLAAERFAGDGPALLLAGNALHADVTPEAAPSALLGWMLVGLAQTVGFPVPVGGSGRIIDALVSRLVAAGGAVRCDAPVDRIVVEGDRAVGVEVAGTPIRARRAVLAACDAQVLYDRLLDVAHLPPAYAAGLRRFERASATVKVNWAVGGPVPWTDPHVGEAGTVHIADSIDELTMTSAELATHHVPAHPFLLIGQMTTADPTRSPAGTESLWAYTHVPQDIRGDAAGELRGTGRLRGDDLARFVERVEDRIEAHAPGFRDRVVARHVQGPDDLEAANPSLVGGDISGGTSQLHQQLVFRPVPGWARPETPVAGLFLASSSAHPGGSVHGACGDNAARAAVWHDRIRRWRR